jgi:hypothetical protein
MKLYGLKYLVQFKLIKINIDASDNNQKYVLIKSLFHVVAFDHPMLSCESLCELIVDLKDPNNLKMHWFNMIGFLINLCMFENAM